MTLAASFGSFKVMKLGCLLHVHLTVGALGGTGAEKIKAWYDKDEGQR
jgi:hypothetical protein